MKLISLKKILYIVDPIPSHSEKDSFSHSCVKYMIFRNYFRGCGNIDLDLYCVI